MIKKFNEIEQISKVNAANAAWFADYEDANLDVDADQKTLKYLLDTAPNSFSKGVIFDRLISIKSTEEVKK